MEEVAEDIAAELLEYLAKLLPEDDGTEGKLGDLVLVKALASYRAVLRSAE